MENENINQELLKELKILNQIQREINIALKILIRDETESRLSHVFKNEDEVLIYQLTDGERTTSEISKYVSVSSKTISRLWQKWDEDYRIVETSGYRNPYSTKYTLEELAMIIGKKKKNIPDENGENEKQ